MSGSNSGSLEYSDTFELDSLSIYDANPQGPVSNPTDYTFTMSSDLLSGSALYGWDWIDVFTFSLRSDGFNQRNNNKIIIDPQLSLTGNNLNPFNSSTLLLSDTDHTVGSRAKRQNSSELRIDNSPTNYIDSFIINNLSDYDISEKYSKPLDRYSSSYAEMDSFREDFFRSYNISVDTNKFIRAHENMWNQSLIQGIRNIVPARSTLSDSSVGVTIKPNILERQKAKNHRPAVQYGETGLYASNLTGKASDLSKEIAINSAIKLRETYELPQEGELKIAEKISLSETSYEEEKTTEISINDLIVETAEQETYKESEIDVNNTITNEISYNDTKDTEISVDSVIVETAEQETYKESEIDVPLIIEETMEKGVTKNGEILGTPLTLGEKVETTDSNAVDYHNLHWIEDFRDLHKEWGTTDGDTHFLNMAAGDESGTAGDYNVLHIEDRFIFRMIGEVEVVSGSFDQFSQFGIDYTDKTNFYNREIRDKGKGYIYKSYMGIGEGPQDGRPVGKTLYYSQSLEGHEFYPVNHISNFSNDRFLDKMWEGTQNENPGYLSVAHEDYATASFYSVEVTGGENEIIVNP